jgi:hypothetical protein
VDAIRELEISLDFVLANSGCTLQEARLLNGTNLARASTSREVLTSPRVSKPKVGASSTPDSCLEVSDAHHCYPSIEGGQPHGGAALPETCLICVSSDSMAGGESPTFRKLKTESPMFQGLPLDPDPRGSEVMVGGEQDAVSEVNPAMPFGMRTLFGDLREAPNLARGTKEPVGTKRLDAHALSRAVAVAILE